MNILTHHHVSISLVLLISLQNTNWNMKKWRQLWMKYCNFPNFCRKSKSKINCKTKSQAQFAIVIRDLVRFIFFRIILYLKYYINFDTYFFIHIILIYSYIHIVFISFFIFYHIFLYFHLFFFFMLVSQHCHVSNPSYDNKNHKFLGPDAITSGYLISKSWI